jgi:hypothetical protein|nr:MAG TPA: tail protein [Caudoviricetes sp.]
MLAFPTDRLDVQLNLNGFRLNGVDSRGVFWHTTFGKVSGLFDGVGTSLKTTQKTWNDGAYSNIPVRAGRTITIAGWLMGQCTPTLVDAWTDFKTALQVGEQQLRVTFDGVSLACTVMQASAPLIKWEGRTVLSYSVELFACDPRLYSDVLLSASTGLPSSVGGMTFPYAFGGDGSQWAFAERVTSGTVTLNNDGDTDSPVTIKITGPVVNPMVEHSSGKRLQLLQTLGAGHYVVFDGRSKQVLLDGSDPARNVLFREWANASVGQNTWRFSSAEYNPQARMTVSFREAYI